jgi:hypothetical protein
MLGDMRLVGGRFEIEREAGAGGMARVYRARDRETSLPVALKISSAIDGASRRRFEREARVLESLRHPGIVGYIAHGLDGNAPFLAMEWIEGEDLERRLARGPLSIADALSLGRAVADALGAAHARGLVHRDVKPSNVFLEGGDPHRPKLLDFGIAHDDTATQGLTVAGSILGTPSHMAPEQASGELDLDPRVDVFALGGLLFACLSGRPPFVASNLVALLAKIVVEDPPRISVLRAEVPPAVDRLIARMLSKSRDMRPSDGAQVAAALATLSDVTPSGRSMLTLASELRVVSILLGKDLEGDAVGLDATLDARGGTLQRLADGSCLMTFVGPESPSDLAARATRIALRLRGTRASIAIATGRAALAGGVPVGDVIERAAQALAAATEREVRIDAVTVGLVEGRFVLREIEGGAIVESAHGDELDAVRTLLGKPTRYVGRDRELAAVEGFYDESVAESIARAVLVTAPAGFGKSRLSRELLRKLAAKEEPPQVLFSRAESVSSGAPFAMAAAALRRAAGIESGTPRESELLERYLERCGARGSFEMLAEMLGVGPSAPSEALAAARANPASMFAAVRVAWEGWLTALLEKGPLLFLMEDLHWGDVPSVGLIDASLLAFAHQRFTVIALARPELRTSMPQLWAARQLHEIRLDPLSKRVSERLVRSALADASDSLVERIVSRANGNAFFLEELIRASAKGDATLPDGILATLQVRFDGLDTRTRAVLRAASIFGERFSRDGIDALVGAAADVDEALQELLAEELVSKSTEAGEGRFSFRHALVREAAYALLTDDDRARGHAAAASFLERAGSHDPLLLAEHHERGGDVGRAARWLRRAAELAVEGNDMVSAIAHARRAERWTTDRSALGALALVVAEAETWLGRRQEARDAGSRASELLSEGSSEWLQAAGLVISNAGQSGDKATVERWLARASAIDPDESAITAWVTCLSRGITQLMWTETVSVALNALSRIDSVTAGRTFGAYAEGRLEAARGYHAYWNARADLTVHAMERAVRAYERAGAVRDALQASLLAHMFRGFFGDYEVALRGLRACIDRALALDARYLADWARFEVAAVQMTRGDRAAGLASFEQVSEQTRSTPLFASGYFVVHAWSSYLAGDIDDVARRLEAGRVAVVGRRYEGALLAYDAVVRLARGDREGARAMSIAALERLDRVTSLRTDVFTAAYTPAIETLLAVDPEAGREALARRVVVLDTITGRFTDPHLRTTYLAVPWTARLLGHASAR